MQFSNRVFHLSGRSGEAVISIQLGEGREEPFGGIPECTQGCMSEGWMENVKI